MSAVSKLSQNQKRRLRLEKNKDHDDHFLNEMIKHNEHIAQTIPENNEETTSENKHSPEIPKVSESTTVTVSRQQIREKALQLWKEIKKYSSSKEGYKNLPDKTKLDIFRTKFGYDTFMTEFPIVSRYMICVGQFSMKAFDRFLDKLESKVHPPPHERAKGYMENEWVCRQADYVTYLWESYQKNRVNTAERRWVWGETYKRLRGEFDDFRSMNEDITEKVKEERVDLDARNARELIERISSGDQTVPEEDKEFLLKFLEELTVKKSLNKVLDELLATTRTIPCSSEGTGHGPDEHNRITMIETVDVARMNEISDKYKPAELRGMEPVLEDEESDLIDNMEM